jgi:hypothetical protein
MMFSAEIERVLGTMAPGDAAAARQLRADSVAAGRRAAEANRAAAEIATRRAAEIADLPKTLRAHSKPGLPAGMKPTTAIIGAVAVGALAVGGMKFLQRRRERAEERSWTQRIDSERAFASQRGRADGLG